MNNPDLVAPINSRSAKSNANTVGESRTMREVMKSHGAKSFTNWRNTDSEIGRKATYFKGSNGSEYMIQRTKKPASCETG